MIPGLDSEALFGAMSRASTERWGSWSSDLMDAPMDYEGDTCAEIVERFVANGQIERVDAVDAGSAVDASTDSDDSMAPHAEDASSVIAPFQPRDAPLQPRDSDDSMAPVLSVIASAPLQPRDVGQFLREAAECVVAGLMEAPMDAPMEFAGLTCAEIIEHFVANGQIERVDAVDAGTAVDASTDSDDSSMALHAEDASAVSQPLDAPLQPRDSDDSMAPVLSDMAWERLPLLVVGWIDSGDNSSSSSSWIARMPEHVRCAARDIYRRRVAKAVRGQKRQADDLQCEVGSGSSHSAEVGGFEQM